MKKSISSSFGISKRENHDSSPFYNLKMYKNFQDTKEIMAENIISKHKLNNIYKKSSEIMSEIPNNSIHLVITSPPYNVNKEYDNNLSLDEYLKLLENVFKETYRVLVDGGRVCINVANIGRKPYIPLTTYINSIMINIGYLMRGEIIWDKSASSGVSLAWGSFQSASNPVLRDTHEYILIFSKTSFKREKKEKNDTITKEKFMEYSKSIWRFPTASAKKIGHPAPFPVELPSRLIEFYSFQNDIILDPFMGSGTTAVAALNLNRYFLGYEINQDYIDIAKKRIFQETFYTQ